MIRISPYESGLNGKETKKNLKYNIHNIIVLQEF